ncbi:hypothetical protein CO652_07020 [Rhizobium sp. H4]|nr:hypothetical protein CO652_07020 [Rhizobium sp. H4]
MAKLRDIVVKKMDVGINSIVILSIVYFLSSYFLLRPIAYYKSFYEEISDTFSFKGIPAGILMLSPQVYLLVVLAAFLHFLRKKHDLAKQLMWIWTAIFVLGSAWTTLVIYAINNE